MELAGLPHCLGRLFPGHDFEALPQGAMGPRNELVPYDGFTSNPLPLAAQRPTTLTRLVQAMSAALMGRGAADLCVVLDDLELANVEQSETVVEVVRAEVRAHIEDFSQRANIDCGTLLAKRLRERASFHLAVPMIESWLFADHPRLVVAGVPSTRRARLVAGRDPEHFLTDDPHYLEADDQQCHQLRARRRRGRLGRAPWIREDRDRHPKAYLSWLCRDPQSKRCTTYRETDHGSKALAQLDWATLIRSPRHMTYARALIGDLADALGIWPTHLAHSGVEAPATSIGQIPPDAVLRNI